MAVIWYMDLATGQIVAKGKAVHEAPPGFPIVLRDECADCPLCMSPCDQMDAVLFGTEPCPSGRI